MDDVPIWNGIPFSVVPFSYLIHCLHLTAVMLVVLVFVLLWSSHNSFLQSVVEFSRGFRGCSASK
jgi:hypothetical protein